MRRKFFIALLAGLSWPACKQDDGIKTYRLAKEPAPVAAPFANLPTGAAQPMPPLPGISPAASAGEINWKVPAGWRERPPSAMRVGSFLVIGDNGRQADVSVIPLSGMAGGDLANVNRWRDQIELPPLSEAELPKSVENLKVDGRSASLVDFVSEKPLIDGKSKKRLIAAALPQGERTWFFKMMGDDETVRHSKKKFIDFLSSVRLKDGDPH